MTFNIKCPYCSKNFTIQNTQLIDVPQRAFDKVNCRHCKSRLALDLNIRKVGKSTMLKKREADFNDRCLERAKAAYASTVDSLVKTWDQLHSWERGNRLGAAARELRKEPAIRIAPCAVCGLKKWRETDPMKLPGHYSRIRSRGACKCKE